MFYSILFYSILFYSILFYSVPSHSILIYSITFHPILFYSILSCFILVYSLFMFFHQYIFYSGANFSLSIQIMIVSARLYSKRGILL